ncbi:MAG: gamma-glutamyltransferase, partial [Proteobacteria bacterium]|nr:gamma-glutamyltransferase [Pseudomonadota bacterium]
MNVVDHGMNIQEAVNAPRVHHQWLPDELRIEEGISPDTIELLECKGHKVVVKETMGAAESIMVESIIAGNGSATLYGAKDPRRAGAAVGY